MNKIYKPPHALKGGGRKHQIKNCKTCGGKPTTVPFELDNMIGNRCDNNNCMLATDWKIKPKDKIKPLEEDELI